MIDRLTFFRLLVAALWRLGTRAMRERDRLQKRLLPGDRLNMKLSLSFDVEIGSGAGSIGEIAISTN